MGIRFRRSVKLFPGVRLNFSNGGISTTVGVRGASVNFGKAGAHLNVGLPGTGLSYRAKLSSPQEQRRTPTASPPALPLPRGTPSSSLPVVSSPPPHGEIRSGAIGEMTSDGLTELKRLINDATIRRVMLTGAVADNVHRVQATERQLRKARRFLIRLFTRGRISRLTKELSKASVKLTEARTDLEGCEIDVDFAFDELTLSSFAALVRAYDILRQSAAIWDITNSVSTNRLAQRTLATEAINRTPVRLDFAKSEVVNSIYQALRLANANGEDIYIYPGFVMMRSAGEDFALIDVRELGVEIQTTRFIEDGEVPADTDILDYTWAKANKDGTPDRRFQDNYQIPVVRYSQLWLRSPTGLQEAYMFSDTVKAERFAAALADYQIALAVLAKSNTLPSTQAPPLLADNEPESFGEDDLPANTPPAPPNTAQRGKFFDWITLLAIVLLLAAGTYELVRRVSQFRGQDNAASTQPKTSQSVLPLAVPAVAVVPLAASVPVAVAPSRELVFVQRNSVNVRAAPSSSSEIIRAEARGKRLAVFQRAGTWVQVGDTVPSGWIHSDMLGASAPSTLAPPLQLGPAAGSTR